MLLHFVYVHNVQAKFSSTTKIYCSKNDFDISAVKMTCIGILVSVTRGTVNLFDSKYSDLHVRISVSARLTAPSIPFGKLKFFFVYSNCKQNQFNFTIPLEFELHQSKMADNNIQLGHYVIIQRQKYAKLIRFNNLNMQTGLGKDQVQMKNIDGHPYSTTFKMVPKKVSGKKVIELEACSDISSLKESLKITESGADNRNLIDDGDQQKLKPDDILKLRESGSSASEIVGQIIENSKTFATKTEYSQDKYLRRKEKKYFE